MIVRPAPALPAFEAARRVAHAPAPFWLASPGAKGDVGIERDVVGCDPVVAVGGSSLAGLEEVWAGERRSWGALAGGGAPIPIGVGFFSYDLGRRFERVPEQAVDDHGFADLEVHFHDAVWVRNADTSEALVYARDERAAGRLLARLADPAGGPSPERPALGALAPDHDDAAYLASVERVLEYLRAGDAYQVNLARRLSAPIGESSGWALAAALRSATPAPHAFWLRCADGAELVGNSPERFLWADGRGLVETRPIKGTRARVDGGEADAAVVAELSASDKDRAEHNMIVDLERNDLGRVCEPGTVVVEDVGRAVSLPTVHHLVSTVRGRLAPGVGLEALLRATFPGGSVTGAPKIRSMMIIDELEPVRRGPYTGATGWLGAAGEIDLAVAIRTATIRDGRLRLHVGGGIVADSTPAAELSETEAKAAAFRRLCAV